MTVIRVTSFKIPKKENQLQMVENYKIMAATAVKEGKPYILSVNAGPLIEDPRSQGYTFACKTEYSCIEDMQYYDTQCEAHKMLKARAQNLGVEGMMMIYYEPTVIA